MPITITEKAAQVVKATIEKQKLPENTYLRVGVKGGGCSGFTYWMDLTETKGAGDEEFEQHGIKVLCDAKSYLYLNDTTVDFKDELMGGGFVLNNPNATRSCGCGNSFSP